MGATLGMALVAMLLATPRLARADDADARLRRMGFAEREGRLEVTSRFSELFDSRAFERLSSGYPTTVVVRGWVYREDSEVPVAFTLVSYRVVYDLWDEVYTLRIDGPDGVKTMRIRSKVDVLARITRLAGEPIAELGSVAIGPHYRFGMVVELNPVSKELLTETRRWLSKPAGKSRLAVTSSVFGSFVSVFVNPRLRAADRILRFRSQPFYRVQR